MFDRVLLISATLALVLGAAIEEDKEKTLDEAQERLKNLGKFNNLDKK